MVTLLLHDVAHARLLLPPHRRTRLLPRRRSLLSSHVWTKTGRRTIPKIRTT
uniref:Uncharacterized protein n=1 Tax=Arundo donax TaxID=35708 RepID=A0A0A9GKK3_ARUDO